MLGAAAALAFGIAGCSSDEKSSSAATLVASTGAAASSPATLEYAGLLIEPSDIDAGWTLKTTQPEQDGITGIFGNSEGTEKISTSIIVRDSPETATAAVAAAKDAASQQAGGVAFSPIEVGAGGGIMYAPDATVVVFSEGSAFAILEFNSSTGERVPDEVAIEIAQKQDAAIKAGVK